MSARSSFVAYATTQDDDTNEHRLVGISAPAYGIGEDQVHVSPADWSTVHYIAWGHGPSGVPTLREPDADPRDLASWVLPQIGEAAWDACTVEQAYPESADGASSSWFRLTLRCAHAERRMDPENLRGDLLTEAVRRLERAGWRSISTKRLIKIALGDESQLPPQT